jgi:hypothetical protein
MTLPKAASGRILSAEKRFREEPAAKGSVHLFGLALLGKRVAETYVNEA